MKLEITSREASILIGELARRQELTEEEERTESESWRRGYLAEVVELKNKIKQAVLGDMLDTLNRAASSNED